MTHSHEMLYGGWEAASAEGEAVTNTVDEGAFDDTTTGFIDAIDVSERQLFAIEDQLRAKGEQPVGEGNWTVREMLCHVVTTADFAELWRRAENSNGMFPTVDQMDAFNAELLAEHRNATVDDLLEEARRSYANSRAAANKMDDAALAKAGPPQSNGETMETGELILFLYNGHCKSHIETLERAVAATN